MSTTRWIGAFEPWASLTMRMMLASAVSLPTLVAVNLKLPVLLSVPPMTSSPTCFSTGIDSPVIIDSSTALAPAITSPSTGIFSPGRMTTRVFDQHLLDREVDLLAVAHDSRGLGLKPDQLFDRLRRFGPWP